MLGFIICRCFVGGDVGLQITHPTQRTTWIRTTNETQHIDTNDTNNETNPLLNVCWGVVSHCGTCVVLSSLIVSFFIAYSFVSLCLFVSVMCYYIFANNIKTPKKNKNLKKLLGVWGCFVCRSLRYLCSLSRYVVLLWVSFIASLFCLCRFTYVTYVLYRVTLCRWGLCVVVSLCRCVVVSLT